MAHHFVNVRPVRSPEDRGRAFAVRTAVFQDEQGIAPELEFDADDDTALHAIAEVGSEVVGTGRLLLREDHARVGRMAVVRAWRSRGVGRAVLEFLVAEAARAGRKRIVLHAQVSAMGFYRRLGFEPVGEEFDEAGIPHRCMERVLA